MKREEFLKQLEQLLDGISEEEKSGCACVLPQLF